MYKLIIKNTAISLSLSPLRERSLILAEPIKAILSSTIIIFNNFNEDMINFRMNINHFSYWLLIFHYCMRSQTKKYNIIKRIFNVWISFQLFNNRIFSLTNCLILSKHLNFQYRRFIINNFTFKTQKKLINKRKIISNWH